MEPNSSKCGAIQQLAGEQASEERRRPFTYHALVQQLTLTQKESDTTQKKILELEAEQIARKGISSPTQHHASPAY